MPKDVRTIKVAYFYPNRGDPEVRGMYNVTLVENSTEYSPGQQLTKDQVNALCDDPSWNVIIIPRGEI